MSFKVDSRGVEALGASTDLRKYMDQVGQECVAAAKDLVPVGRTGDLRDSIDHRLDREDGVWMVHVFFGKFYGLFHEFPTSRQPVARPFLRPGVLKVISRRGGRLGDDGRR